MKKIIVTGGCGFIGSHFAIEQINQGNFVINLDKMTYAANAKNVAEIATHKNYRFVEGDICNKELVLKILNEFEIDWLVNFAAETHVDNSISSAEIFVKTNVFGTFSLLEAANEFYQKLNSEKKNNFRFLHISTDEVFGCLALYDAKFNEESNYQPNSPYSASKAASDHLVRAWNKTYNLPIIITNCSNNFGPKQHAEKLIPTIIASCLGNKKIPIYGDGKNIRDWIYVKDHCRGIALALNDGKLGESYCLGGDNEIENIEIAKTICEILDRTNPRQDKKSYKEQIKFVKDRPGHDFRYAIDNAKAKKTLGFKNQKSFAEALEETVKWYVEKMTTRN